MVAPIEEQINGVENMLYMSSNSSGDGRFSIGVTFELGTNLDIAQVQVQNRVADRAAASAGRRAQHRRHRRQGLVRPDDGRAPAVARQVARRRCSSPTTRLLEIKDALTRVDGVGSIIVFGSRDYSMRVWLDPDRLQSLGMTANDVTTALQGQNIQVASGILNQPPVNQPGAFQISVQTLGRLADPEEFANIVVKQTPTPWCGSRMSPTVELSGLDYSSNSYLNLDPAVAIAVFQRPGSNALATAQAIRATMAEASKRFPPG